MATDPTPKAQPSNDQEYFFPDLGVVVVAKSREEADKLALAKADEAKQANKQDTAQ